MSKVAGEALGSLYHSRHGLDVICLRILTCAERPPTVRSLSTWLSPDDAGRLFEACLTAPAPGFRVIFGVSANTRGGWVSLDEARALGYHPRDDAEAFAAEVIAAARRAGPGRPGPGPPRRRVHAAGPEPLTSITLRLRVLASRLPDTPVGEHCVGQQRDVQ